jgi:tRNA U34 5-carboxymethylaminomethyl modifying enzyme MnmG/GidA
MSWGFVSPCGRLFSGRERLDKGPAKSQRQECLDARNILEIQELDKNRFTCTANCEGRTINYQVMKKNNVDVAPARRSTGTSTSQGTVVSDW